ncbi:MAG: mechanosensitive ion channel domain-containing protein [Desulfococcaceae bacterium]
MSSKKTRLPALFILLPILWCLVYVPFAFGQETDRSASSNGISDNEIQRLIQVLEDPEAREKLIQQLTILSRAEAETAPEEEVDTAAARMLQGISQRMESVTDAMMKVAGTVNRLPQGLEWADRQIRHPENRAFWIEVSVNIGVVVLLGIVLFHFSRFLFKRPRRALAENGEYFPVWNRLLRLFARFVLDLVPIALFALSVYVILGFFHPLPKTRLVVLAWAHAFILNRLVIVASRAIFSARAPKLRLPRFTDETAHYLEIWTKRLSGVIIYGYAALQAALLLGMDQQLYDGTLRLFGLLIALLLIVFVLQNRQRVGDHLRNIGKHRKAEHKPVLRRTLEQAARLWHILVIFYILLFYAVWVLKMPGGAYYLLKGTVLSLLAVVIGIALLRSIHPLFHKQIRISADLSERFPRLEHRVNQYMEIIYKGIRIVVIALVILAILQAWGVDSFGWLAGDTGQLVLETLLSVIGILALAFIVWEAANTYIEKYLQAKTEDGVTQVYSARTRTLMSVIRKALLITLVVITTLTVLSELGVDIAPLLAGAGVLGLAIGFGAQKLVQDVITGVFILLEDQISEGDVVNVGGKAGLVEAVDIRTLRLRDLSGTVHTLPYSAIDSVSNLTKGFSFYVFDVGVAYREDVDEVMAVLQEIGAEMQNDPEYGKVILEPLEVLGVDAFADSAVIVKARIKTVPIQQWWVGREFNRRMKKRFDELDIEIPFPHQTLYFGVDKEQKAPPARVRILSKNGEELSHEAFQAEPGEREPAKTVEGDGENT